MTLFVQTLENEGQALLHTAHRFQTPESQAQLEALTRACILTLNTGGKIILTGVGKSGKIAQKISSTLASTGSPSIYLHPTEALHGDLGLVNEKDIVLALSYSGNTQEILELIPYFKEKKVTLIGMGSNIHSQLGEQCAFWLDASVESEACPHNLAPTTSTTVMLALGDALAVSLMQAKGFTADQFSTNHPGGGLGKKLQLHVRDLMHSNPGKLSPQSSMREVISLSTQTKLGAVCIEENGKLIGLITDGDIRRALAHEEKFFKFTARDVMTPKPISISPECSAWDALSLMEKRSSQISVLPVIDASHKVLGLLRLHDLVQGL